MIIIKALGKLFYLTFLLTFYIMIFPLWLIGKLLFWWLPGGSDSYGDSDEEWLFWKEHGHDW